MPLSFRKQGWCRHGKGEHEIRLEAVAVPVGRRWKKEPNLHQEQPRKSLGEQTQGLVLMRRVCACLFFFLFGVGGSGGECPLSQRAGMFWRHKIWEPTWVISEGNHRHGHDDGRWEKIKMELKDGWCESRKWTHVAAALWSPLAHHTHKRAPLSKPYTALTHHWLIFIVNCYFSHKYQR